jgi:hypothetical protein
MEESVYIAFVTSPDPIVAPTVPILEVEVAVEFEAGVEVGIAVPAKLGILKELNDLGR